MDEIREWPIHPEFRISPREDVPAKSLIRFGYGLIQLMSGTLPGEPDGTAWFFGTGEQLEVIKMRLS